MPFLHIPADEGAILLCFPMWENHTHFEICSCPSYMPFLHTTHFMKVVGVIGPGRRPVLAAPTEVDPLMAAIERELQAALDRLSEESPLYEESSGQESVQS